MIYLDHNATSFLRPAVLAAMQELEGAALNPSSVHGVGRRARQKLEEARRKIARIVSVFPTELFFTGSATEANNAVLRGFCGAKFVAATEHASVSKTGALLGADTLPVDANGVLDMAILDAKLAALGGAPALVSVMLANNETGVIQPICDIAAVVHRHGGLLHTDAVQALGKIPLDCGVLGADMVTLGAHKIGGPVGIGALIMRQKQPLTPLLTGGGQESGHRAGTEDVLKAVGFAALMCEVANCRGMVELAHMRDTMEAALKGSVVIAKDAPRLPNTSMVAMPGVAAETQIIYFDLEGFAVSAGSACSSGRISSSHVLRAMGVEEVRAACAIRISLGWNTTAEEIRSFTAAWLTARSRLGNKTA